MFKRMNKVTSLLIAAAAVTSLMPMGVSAATLKDIEGQKGEIYNAIAYKDGKIYIDGQPYKKDEAVYYVSDGKYSKLDDIDSEDKAEIYGSKYVEVEGGDHYVDLSTGKVSSDNDDKDKIRTKDLDDASVELRNNIKSDNDGRFNENDAKAVKDLIQLPKSKFQDGWYSTSYNINKPEATLNGGAKTSNVYTDGKGKYIDADYNLGKIKVKLSNGKIATIENTVEESENFYGSVKDSKVIAQDSKNIYRLVTVLIKSSTEGATIKEVNGVELDDSTTAYTISKDKRSVSFRAVQIVSKSQSSKDIDGIKYSKDVSTYALSDKAGKKVDLLSEDKDAFTIAENKLINYKVDGDELKAAVLELKSKSSTYYVEDGNSDNVNLINGETSVDVDADGNLWALSGDNLYMFDNDQDFEKMYSLDKEYSQLSVYDKDDLVVWNTDESIYSIVGKKTETKEEDNTNKNTDVNTNPSTNTNTTTNNTTTVPSTTVKPGWGKNNDGKWIYGNADGTLYKGWLNNGQQWYYLDPVSGVMIEGWKEINNNWYYFEGSGAMHTGWLNNNGTWYYLNDLGAMVKNTTIGGYKIGYDGVWIK